MSQTTDFVHTENIIDAILSEIEDNAPSAWTTSGDEEELRLLGYGSIEEYAVRDITGGSRRPSIIDECPAIMVRAIGADPGEYTGTGGKTGLDERFRVVMVRTFEQTYDSDGDETTVARGKARYAKLLSKAIFTNRALGHPTLSTDDTSADVISVDFVSLDTDRGTPDTEYIANLPAQVWALALDISVQTSTV
jgi:hypothetical protein